MKIAHFTFGPFVGIQNMLGDINDSSRSLLIHARAEFLHKTMEINSTCYWYCHCQSHTTVDAHFIFFWNAKHFAFASEALCIFRAIWKLIIIYFLQIEFVHNFPFFSKIFALFKVFTHEGFLMKFLLSTQFWETEPILATFFTTAIVVYLLVDSRRVYRNRCVHRFSYGVTDWRAFPGAHYGTDLKFQKSFNKIWNSVLLWPS